MKNSFHLSIPISNRENTVHFYSKILGGELEEKSEQYFNIYLYDAQLTFHIIPDKVIETEHFHFGFNIDLNEYKKIHQLLIVENVEFILKPNMIDEKTRSKLIVKDPDHYLIEFKHIP